MAKAKKNDIKSMVKSSVDELSSKIVELKKELMQLRFKLSAGQLAKTHDIRSVRRKIATLKTFRNAKLNETKKKTGAK